MILTFLFWYFIVSLASWAVFGLILIYDRIKYGKWAEDYPKHEDDLS